jgi:trehalose/maltose hydrolase-like predicted phosphorylase
MILLLRVTLRFHPSWKPLSPSRSALHRAVNYARAALLMDLADVVGNVKDGCHIASMGSTWMVFTHGFGGLRRL